MDSAKVLPLIDAIYSAASDPSLWPAVAQQVQHAIGGHSVNLGIEDTKNPKFNFLYTNGATASQMVSYGESCIGQDQFLCLLDRTSPGEALLTQDILDERQLHSLFPYEDFYEDLGYTYHNAGLFYRDEDHRGWISVIRSLNDSRFTPDELKLMQTLVPHLQRAFMINLQLMKAQRDTQIGLDSLEHLSAAALLLSDKGDVLSHNSKAQKYLCRTSAKIQNYGVRLPEAKANLQLQKLIRAILYGSGIDSSGVVPFYEFGVRKTVLCFPWRTTSQQLDWLGQATGCILFILSPSTSAPPTEQLKQTFNLSKAEVRVLQGLLDGSSVSSLTEQLFVTDATVRYHIRNLLRKTESRNQVELITKVMKLTTVLVE